MLLRMISNENFSGAVQSTSFLMDVSWNQTLSKLDESRMVEVSCVDSLNFDETTTVPCDLVLTCEKCADESCVNYESYMDQAISKNETITIFKFFTYRS